jgi:hypothetical protein
MKITKNESKRRRKKTGLAKKSQDPMVAVLLLLFFGSQGLLFINDGNRTVCQRHDIRRRILRNR